KNTCKSPDQAPFRIAHSTNPFSVTNTKKKMLSFSGLPNDLVIVKQPEIKKSYRYYPDGPGGNYPGL
ncbi:MAG TPA: hypothetical protein VEX63_05410, partial [Flavisolibacter sp.]|nr:hypothetical protein [Flavisolibacter sp.]